MHVLCNEKVLLASEGRDLLSVWVDVRRGKDVLECFLFRRRGRGKDRKRVNLFGDEGDEAEFSRVMGGWLGMVSEVLAIR